jgi:ectoine hydroxylase-related dioxygenase (phytanoyl-CoA dioxygenase family)
VICRTENVSACHEGVRELVEGSLKALAERALGVEATAFKDKLNYKQPGGAGFSPHQDLLAYPGVHRVVSVLLAVDECTMESGCLWIAEGVDQLLATDDRGVVREDIAAALTWAPAELAPGDVVCIGGWTPHYSEANRSNQPRRVLVASYAPATEGYDRDTYYRARQAAIDEASAADGRFRISTLADFEGTQVAAAADAPVPGVCTH